MVWKFVVAITLIAVVVEGSKSRRWPCNQAKNKLDVCRENGYVIGDCKVGDGELTAWQRRKCEKMEEEEKVGTGEGGDGGGGGDGGDR